MADLVEVVAELTNERFFGERASQEPAVRREWIDGTKESEALDQFTNKGIHGDHAFRLEFAKRDVNRPLILARGAEALKRQIGTFANAHASVTNQQKGVAAQIVTADQLLLPELTLLCSKWPGKPSREARNVLAGGQKRGLRKRCRPGQFTEEAPRGEEQGARILQVDVVWGDLNIEQRGLDIGVPH